MNRVKAGRWFRPVFLFGLIVFVGVVASLMFESRPKSGVDIATGSGAPAATDAATEAPATTEAPAVVDPSEASPTTEFSGDGTSPVTEQPRVDAVTDYGPPVTVGDYTMFCPALDRLAALDGSRAVLVDVADAAKKSWTAERGETLQIIDRTLNYRSSAADADIAIMLATADDSPSDGPLSPEAAAAIDRIRDFAGYSCEVNSSLPPQPPVVDDPESTTTEP